MVTIKPAAHGANALLLYGCKPATSALDLLKTACRSEFQNVKDNNVIQTSFLDLATFTGNSDDREEVYGQHNGFVDSAVQAYNQHHNLVIRPDDVWFAILAQLNIYINEHAEDLRDMFVSHQGQKKLVIEAGKDIGGKEATAMGVDFGKFAYKMSSLIAGNIKDPSLREWILPQFTTTTKSDQTVASIMMMSTMKKYFYYGCYICCGLPSVTLLGQQADWQRLITKAKRLPTFGKECATWHSLLMPVLKRFVSSFESSESEETKDFWQKIAHYSGGGSGPTYLSGWITAFCFWDVNGKPLYVEGKNPYAADDDSRCAKYVNEETPVLDLDKVRYHRIETDEVPPGWASVPVELDNDGEITNCVMVAGLVGMRATSSGEELHNFKTNGEGEKTGMDTLAPESGWWMYEVNGV